MSEAPQKPAVMLGMSMPDIDLWSDRVAVALGQNPGPFTGPGTNTNQLGTGDTRILLDPGQGVDGYLDFLEQAMERAGCESIQEIVLTHGHPDHIGGCQQVMDRFGTLSVSKMPWPEVDAAYDFSITPLADDDRIRTEGVTLRALHTPGHAPDHLCFIIEEERSLISGDNVLGVGTTVIPSETGDLAQYMDSLERLLAEEPGRIYPAHGPCIEDGPAKIREYLAHRRERDTQILDAMAQGASEIPTIVAIVYAAYPEALHAAAGQSVASHLLKLEREGRVRRDDASEPATAARWQPNTAS